MAASIKPSSRYSSFDSRSSTSSLFSDPCSSAEFTSSALAPSGTSRALARTKPSDLSRAKPPSLTTAMKNLMAKNKSGRSSNKEMRLVIPVDAIAQDLKKTSKKQGLGLGLSGLPKKLFGSDKKKKKEVKALTDVKVHSNARTLAMVLRSERELLGANKEMEMEIAALKLMLEQKKKEVEKLKDLCLSQKEEIKALKDAILFPDVMKNQLQGLVERQGSELKQAKQIIPALQRQVTSLTGQLQCLAEGLEEVKADRYSAKKGLRYRGSSPRGAPMYNQEEAANSLEFSSEDVTTPGSPDDLFLKDLNPCLTPHQEKTKSKEFEAMSYDSPSQGCRSSHARRVSRSSEPFLNSNAGSSTAQCSRRSNDSKTTYTKPTYNRLF